MMDPKAESRLRTRFLQRRVLGLLSEPAQAGWRHRPSPPALPRQGMLSRGSHPRDRSRAHSLARRGWHITSTDIHEASFPRLNSVIPRASPMRSPSWVDEPTTDVLIGGGGAPESRKREIKKVINGAL